MRLRSSRRYTMTVHQLNQHPLNLAAHRRLRQEGGLPLQGQMSLLSLGHHALGEAEPDHPSRKPLVDAARSPLLQQAALDNLQDSLSPKEVENLPLSHLGRAISQTLQGAWTPGSQ